MRERIKKEVKITETVIEGSLDEVIQKIKFERRSGHLVISFSYGGEVGKKFERIEAMTKDKP